MRRHDRTTTDASRAPRRGFTLIELLVTITIIAILLSLVLAAFGPFRSAANQTDSLSSLRQMAAGFNAYTTDHGGRLMPGYLSDAMVDPTASEYLGLAARNRHGNAIPDEALKSYVWRLAPYLEHAWETMLTDYQEPDVVSKAGEAVAQEIYYEDDSAFSQDQHFPVSDRPSFGMNSIYVGGDAVHGGAEVTAFSPWNTAGNPSIAATRLSEVQNPGRLIVFGAVGRVDAAVTDCTEQPYALGRLGNAELRAPYTVYNPDAAPNGVKFENQQWQIGCPSLTGSEGLGDDLIRLGASADFGDTGGVPILRWSRENLPVAKVDGSTAASDINALSTDMRNWAWQATGINVPRTAP